MKSNGLLFYTDKSYRMKKAFTFLLYFLFIPFSVFCQTFSISIQNGYSQTTQAAAGDTVHIWAKAWGAAQAVRTVRWTLTVKVGRIE